MNKIITIVFLLNVGLLTSQTHQNLVYNGSFEQDKNGFNLDANNCTNPYGTNGYSVMGGLSGYSWSDQIDYWSEVYGWTCPEKRDLCLGVGSADILCIENPNATIESRSGLIYATGTGNEFITQPLREMLNPLSLYYIEFYHWSTSIIEERGIRFSEDRPKQCQSGSTNLQDDLDIKFSENTNSEYKKVTMYYKPQRADHKWMTIGQGTGRFTIDDIRIFEVGDDKCADGEWQIQNTDLYTWAYNASDKIIAGSNVSSNYYAYNGDVTVKSGNSVWFKAGNQVILEPGFSTEDGAYFETIIEPGCSPFDPCSNFKPSGQDYVNCGSNTTVIGPAVVEDYMTYLWSPSTYLDDPNIANPTFTPPPSGSGNIQYTLTMTPLCGGFVNTSVFPPTIENVANIDYNVLYFSNPDPVPSFSLNSFNFDKCSADFGIDVNSNTRSVLVEITNVQTGAIWFQQQYEMMNYACCNFNWSSSANIPDIYWNSFNSCANYNIKIKTNNWCNETVYYEENLLWEQETTYQLLTPLGNVITPASTPGQNDWLVLNATGVSSTFIYIYNQWGSIVYSKFSSNYCQNSQSGKLWAGQCNGNFCSQGCVNNGVYYYVLFVYPCSGGVIDYSGNISVFLDSNNSNNTYCNNLSQKSLNDSPSKETQYMDSLAYSIYQSNVLESEKENVLNNEISLYPNPSSGNVTLDISSEILNSVISIEVFDALGRKVFDKFGSFSNREILSLNVSNGIYTILVNCKNKSIPLRCVIQK